MQLEERVGFVHAFRPLGAAETRHILAQQWAQLGLTKTAGDFTDAEAIAAIIRARAASLLISILAALRESSNCSASQSS